MEQEQKKREAKEAKAKGGKGSKGGGKGDKKREKTNDSGTSSKDSSTRAKEKKKVFVSSVLWLVFAITLCLLKCYTFANCIINVLTMNEGISAL